MSDTNYNYNTIVLNKNNIVSGSKNSVFKYTFNQSLRLNDCSLAIQSINMYYSWFNISDYFRNNKFSYVWFDNAGDLNTTIDVTIPDGYYTVELLNKFLQSELEKRGHYLIQQSTGDFAYHIEFISNVSYYSVQLNVYAMMTEAQAGTDFVKGSETWSYPLTATTPQLVVSNSSSFGDLIGYSNGSYPSTASNTNTTFLSNKTPNMTPVSSIKVVCSMTTQNGFSNPDGLLYSFTSGSVEFGGMIDREPKTESFVKVRDALYSSFTIELYDQDMRRLDIRDAETVIMLIIKSPADED